MVLRPCLYTTHILNNGRDPKWRRYQQDVKACKRADETRYNKLVLFDIILEIRQREDTKDVNVDSHCVCAIHHFVLMIKSRNS